MAAMVYLADPTARLKRCALLGRSLNNTAKDLYRKTGANVAVFVRSDQGREYRYASPVPGGVDAVMDRAGYVPVELDLIVKLRRDRDALDLGDRTMAELLALSNQLLMASEGIRVARENLG